MVLPRLGFIGTERVSQPSPKAALEIPSKPAASAETSEQKPETAKETDAPKSVSVQGADATSNANKTDSQIASPAKLREVVQIQNGTYHERGVKSCNATLMPFLT